MGNDLILDLLVLAQDKEPDFGAARAALDSLTSDEIEKGMQEDGYYGEELKDPQCKEEFLNEVKDAIEIVEAGFKGDHRDFTWFLLKDQWWILISGGMSYGDEPEGVRAIRLFHLFDLYKKAGFE